MAIEIQWTPKTPTSNLFFPACSCYCFIILFDVSFLSFFLLAEYEIRVFFLHFSCLPYRRASTDLALSTSPTSLCLYNTIGLFTINQKQAMLDLQFKHLQVSLQQDPHGGPLVPMIELQPQFVKSILGMSKL